MDWALNNTQISNTTRADQTNMKTFHCCLEFNTPTTWYQQQTKTTELEGGHAYNYWTSNGNDVQMSNVEVQQMQSETIITNMPMESILSQNTIHTI